MSFKLYCISDAHLGAHSPEKEERKRELLNSFLEFILESDDQLLICGDLFDFWFEYKWAIPKLHFRTLSLLSDITASGREIHYLAGNHDFWVGDFIQNEIGLTLHKDDYIFCIKDKKVFACHGDGLCQKDHLYRAMKKILRNPVNILLYRLIHPDLGIPLALHFSHESRESKSDKSGYSDIDYRQFAYAKIEEGFDYVIMGHTHWPAVEQHSGGWYLNPGNWINDFTFLLFDPHPRLLQWNGQKAQKFVINTPPGNRKN